ncbi:hypothetical protein BU24DRAFT_483960 [Aaosphaeria arxii CBS 175.79]|uniref:Uncharacterized protein n=1 Tax=Aaosphaeria arxii CBS 175.79 TaxID=1450172 RepID=A0A6A5XMK1_9PLEO|nr:uncharacterized protein BU24DRAFT_483960 [Aaosphaeria arxii CBS 175.79]KAF2014041.1 hypothetical protein BU24DRAFT_483960 [Aaosphaeria arxii CBS 175.79]
MVRPSTSTSTPNRASSSQLSRLPKFVEDFSNSTTTYHPGTRLPSHVPTWTLPRPRTSDPLESAPRPGLTKAQRSNTSKSKHSLGESLKNAGMKVIAGLTKDVYREAQPEHHTDGETAREFRSAIVKIDQQITPKNPQKILVSETEEVYTLYYPYEGLCRLKEGLRRYNFSRCVCPAYDSTGRCKHVPF